MKNMARQVIENIDKDVTHYIVACIEFEDSAAASAAIKSIDWDHRVKFAIKPGSKITPEERARRIAVALVESAHGQLNSAISYLRK